MLIETASSLTCDLAGIEREEIKPLTPGSECAALLNWLHLLPYGISDAAASFRC